MRRLIVMRHAKSSWDNPHLSDSERPLNKRGLKNAPEMGKRLRKLEIHPDLIYSSKANRALTTAKYVSEKVNYPVEDIQITDILYHRDPEEIANWIRSFDDNNETIMIFGHNPGFTDFVNFMSDSNLYNLPTAGLAIIHFEVAEWKRALPGTGILAHYDFPKNKN